MHPDLFVLLHGDAFFLLTNNIVSITRTFLCQILLYLPISDIFTMRAGILAFWLEEISTVQ
jgi:hypothetical protein